MKSAKDRKDDKLTVEQILRIEGINYEEWLDGLHDEILNRPSTKELMRKALRKLSEDVRETNNKVVTDSNENEY